MQMDLIRQQLEFEAQHIRSLMEERFGTSDEMVQRAQVQGLHTELRGEGGVLGGRSPRQGGELRGGVRYGRSHCWKEAGSVRRGSA